MSIYEAFDSATSRSFKYIIFLINIGTFLQWYTHVNLSSGTFKTLFLENLITFH